MSIVSISCKMCEYLGNEKMRMHFIFLFSGEQEVELVCRDTSTGLQAPESHCDAADRPASKFVPCNTDPCPPK